MRIGKLKCLLCVNEIQTQNLKKSPVELAEEHGWYSLLLKRGKGKREDRLEGFVSGKCGTGLITQA